MFTFLDFVAKSHENSIYIDFFNVIIFALVGISFVVFNVAILSRLLRPRIEEAGKGETYECGELPIGDSWVRFDIRFYTIALVFLIFDVEIAFLLPWAVVFKGSGLWGTAPNAAGAFVLLEMLLFMVVLLVGLVYVWVKGDLDWVRSSVSQERSESNGGTTR